MNDFSENQNVDIKKQDNNKKKYFSNVFSNMDKIERDKKYQILQKNLYLLSKDIKLLEEYANKDNFGSKKKNRYGRIRAFKNENQYQRFRGRNSILLHKKLKFKYSLPLNMINSNSNSKDNSINNSVKKKNIKEKKYNKSCNDRLIYKTEINKYPVLINGKQLPKISINSDIGSETKIDSSINNVNISNSSRLPSIQNKDSKRLYFYTDNNNENKKTIKNKKMYSRNFHLPTKNINLENNLVIQDFPSIINSQRLKSSINRNELEYSADKVMKKMQEKNIKIKKKINYKLSEQDLVDWEMKSKIKLSQWKFGIAEIEKYFVDLRAYGKPEEEELLKRKTFYDEVEDVIDEIKQTKEERELNKIKKIYNKEEKKNLGGYNKEEKNDEKNDDINMVDNTLSKHVEISDALKVIKKRKMIEERKRNIINNILVQSELRRRKINRSTDKLHVNNYENDENNNNIHKKRRISDLKKYNNKGLLINNPK